VRNPINILQYWLGNAEILGGKAKPELNNLKSILLKDNIENE